MTTDANRPKEKDMSNSQANFVWHELHTTDADAAKAFYRNVVGWRTRDTGMPGMRSLLSG